MLLFVPISLQTGEPLHSMHHGIQMGVIRHPAHDHAIAIV